jgi:hypothetical protein
VSSYKYCHRELWHHQIVTCLPRSKTLTGYSSHSICSAVVTRISAERVSIPGQLLPELISNSVTLLHLAYKDRLDAPPIVFAAWLSRELARNVVQNLDSSCQNSSQPAWFSFTSLTKTGYTLLPVFSQRGYLAIWRRVCINIQAALARIHLVQHSPPLPCSQRPARHSSYCTYSVVLA